jgi:hypothetical protein
MVTKSNTKEKVHPTCISSTPRVADPNRVGSSPFSAKSWRTKAEEERERAAPMTMASSRLRMLTRSGLEWSTVVRMRVPRALLMGSSKNVKVREHSMTCRKGATNLIECRALSGCKALVLEEGFGLSRSLSIVQMKGQMLTKSGLKWSTVVRTRRRNAPRKRGDHVHSFGKVRRTSAAFGLIFRFHPAANSLYGCRADLVVTAFKKNNAIFPTSKQEMWVQKIFVKIDHDLATRNLKLNYVGRKASLAIFSLSGYDD